MIYEASAAPDQDGKPLRRVEVWLVEPVTKMIGKAWPRLDNGKPQALTAIEEPVYMVMHLPSGRVVESFSFGVSMEAQEEMVAGVRLQPLTKLVGHLEVTDAAEKIIRDWGAGNDEIFNDLKRWRTSFSSDPVLIPHDDRVPSGEMKQLAASEIEPGVYLTATRGIHRDWQHKEGWYLHIDFWAGHAIDRKMGRTPLGKQR